MDTGVTDEDISRLAWCECETPEEIQSIAERVRSQPEAVERYHELRIQCREQYDNMLKHAIKYGAIDGIGTAEAIKRFHDAVKRGD